MELFMKENSKRAASTVMELTSGVTGAPLQEAGTQTTLMERGSTCGPTVEAMRAAGKIISCMAVGFMFGPMEENTMGNTWMTRRKALGFITGQTASATKDSGSMENSMERARS